MAERKPNMTAESPEKDLLTEKPFLVLDIPFPRGLTKENVCGHPYPELVAKVAILSLVSEVPGTDHLPGHKLFWSKLKRKLCRPVGADGSRVLNELQRQFLCSWIEAVQIFENDGEHEQGGRGQWAKYSVQLFDKFLKNISDGSTSEQQREVFFNSYVTYALGIVAGAAFRFATDVRPRTVREKTTLARRRDTRKSNADQRANAAYKRFLELKRQHERTYPNRKFRRTAAYRKIAREMKGIQNRLHWKTVGGWILEKESG
jgi:hypothetical protein